MSDEPLVRHARSTVAAAAWDPPSTGVVLGRLVEDATPLEQWRERVAAATGVEVGPEHLVVAAVARALVAAPGLNSVVRLGRRTQRNGVGVTLVRRGRARRVDDADVLEAPGLVAAVEGTEDDVAAWEHTGRSLRFVPAPLLRRALRLLGALGRLGSASPAAGLEPGAAGAAVVEVGVGFDAQFSPPVPHAAAGVHVVVGPVTDRVLPVAGAPAVRPTLSLDVAVDARLCPADELDVLLATLRAALADPDALGLLPGA